LPSAELEPFIGGNNFQSTPTIAKRPVEPQFIAPVNNLNMAPSRPIAVAPHPISAAANFQSTPTIAQRQLLAPFNARVPDFETEGSQNRNTIHLWLRDDVFEGSRDNYSSFWAKIKYSFFKII
jgi:hypothetical protein